VLLLLLRFGFIASAFRCSFVDCLMCDKQMAKMGKTAKQVGSKPTTSKKDGSGDGNGDNDDDEEGKSKPNRKKRRRPKNLMEVHARRQRKHRWLETHLWHAKRMRMQYMWGYRLVLYSILYTLFSCFRCMI
jgi:hypothetical protein